MTFGQWLKKFREETRFSQSALAKEVGCCQTSLSDYELEIRRPNYKIMREILRVAKKYKFKTKFKII